MGSYKLFTQLMLLHLASLAATVFLQRLLTRYHPFFRTNVGAYVWRAPFFIACLVGFFAFISLVVAMTEDQPFYITLPSALLYVAVTTYLAMQVVKLTGFDDKREKWRLKWVREE